MTQKKRRYREPPCEVSAGTYEEVKRRGSIPRGEGARAGWIRVGRFDSPRRRSLWVRFIDEGTDTDLILNPKAIEFCSGREGDDGFIKLRPGQKITAAVWREIVDVFLLAADHIPERWGTEQVPGQKGNP